MSTNLAKMKIGEVAWVSAFNVGDNGYVTFDVPVVRIECIKDVEPRIGFESLREHRVLDTYFKRSKKYATKLLWESHIHATEEEAIKYYEERVQAAVKQIEREAERLVERAKQIASHTLSKKGTKTKSNLTI